MGLLLLSALLGGLLGSGVTWLAAARWSPAHIALFGTPTLPPTRTRVPTSTHTPAFTQTAWPTATDQPTSTPTSSPTLAPSPTAMLAPTLAPELASLVARAGAAVVTVVNTHAVPREGGTSEGETVWGSGVIVQEDGYILTNEHVAGNSAELVAILNDGNQVPVRYVAGDPTADLALLKIEYPGTYPTITWGNSEQLRPGDRVVVIGSPLGNLPNSVTTGVVSGLDRTVQLENESLMSGLIQTDAAINRGNSGGPMLDPAGQLVGVVALIVRENNSSGEPDVQGIGFAIPSTRARALTVKWVAADAPKRRSSEEAPR